jgi:predicted transcriptional regulator
MKLREVIDTLDARVLLNNRGNEVEVERARASDLMSDVLHRIKPGALLLTGLTTPQSVYTAEMADVSVVCYVRGKKPPEEVLKLAAERNLVLLSTDLPLYESCGKLYRQGLRGGTET